MKARHLCPYFLLTAGLWAQGTRNDATLGLVVGPVTQGGVNYLVGGASDLVFDRNRDRLYLVNTSQRRIEVYSVLQRRFLSVVQTDLTPLAAAISVSGQFLYVTAYDASALNVIDLDQLAVVRRVSLPAKPEAVAVGYDERVLLTTIGTGTNNAANTLLIYNPTTDAAPSPIDNVIFTPPAPTSPVLPPPSGRMAFGRRASLKTSLDGRRIIGFMSIGAANANQRAAFVYDVASASILRSRIVGDTSTVLAVSPDGSKFMAGLRLFDAETMQVLAQASAANLPYTLAAGTNLNTQLIQGGAAFSPDGRSLYAVLNLALPTTPAMRSNISQLLQADPDNLLVGAGFKLPENLSGNLVMASDGGTGFALSESGFVIVTLSQIRQSPVAATDATSVLLATDQCGVTAALRRGIVSVTNAGSGRIAVSTQLVTAGRAQPAATAPGSLAQPTASGANVNYTFNATNGRAPGTIPPHDFQIVAPDAVNLPPEVRVYQNTRDAEARGNILLRPTSPSLTDGLVDMAHDTFRQRLYIANAGQNQVEVFDLRSKTFLSPVKVGQLPRSLALTPDGITLYVANGGGESISIVDPERLQVTGSVRFPALAFNSAAAILTPAVIAATERGLQIVMSNGTLWRLVGNEAVPRPASPSLGSAAIPAPWSMAATPNGEFAILLGGNGTVYLYDALADDYVQSRQVFAAPIQGFFGPITAGPRGQYFVVNGVSLNQALSLTSPATLTRPVPALVQLNATTYARFVQPVLASATSLPATPPQVEIVDAVSGQVRGSAANALEGPLLTQVGTNRVNVNGRTMALDPADNTAYILTTSGLSAVPLDPVQATDRPTINPGGIVNLASYRTDLAPGSLLSIFGRNLGRSETAPATPLPVSLGGVCVTMNNVALPLFMTSPGQINAQVPVELAAGTYPVIVRAIESKLQSPQQNARVQRVAPAVLVDVPSLQAAVYHHSDGSPVTLDNPTHRDDRLVIYAIGLGATTGGRVVSGQPAPSRPLAEISTCEVFFGDPRYNEAQIDVEWCGLVPGYVGLYQINVYVPWYVIRGEKVPVTVSVGGVSSPAVAPVLPSIAIR